MSKLEHFGLRFLGAAQTVTGSMHLLEVGERRLLVDCGMYQGRRKESQPPQPQPAPAGQGGRRGAADPRAHRPQRQPARPWSSGASRAPIHCTAATGGSVQRHAAGLGAHPAVGRGLAQQEAPRRSRTGRRSSRCTPKQDAAEALARFEPHGYDEEFSPFQGVKARFIDAGHVLGSASIDGGRADERPPAPDRLLRRHRPPQPADPARPGDPPSAPTTS